MAASHFANGAGFELNAEKVELSWHPNRYMRMWTWKDRRRVPAAHPRDGKKTDYNPRFPSVPGFHCCSICLSLFLRHDAPELSVAPDDDLLKANQRRPREQSGRRRYVSTVVGCVESKVYVCCGQYVCFHLFWM
jgi:hypothetical protein